MKKNSTYAWLFFFLSFFSMVFCTQVQAASNSFSVSPLDPETNHPQSSYFDLTVSPKETRELHIRIYNSADKDIQVKIEANNGSTNDNGITSYLNEDEVDPTLKIPFQSLATIKDKVVTVPKQGTYDATIQLMIPETSFEGVILGGIRLSSVEKEEDLQTETSAVAANIAYTIGVVLSESDEVIEPQMNLLGIKTEQRNGRNYISANLQNAAPRIIQELEVKATVYPQGESDILYEASSTNLRMAPNSNFHYGVSLEDQAFQPGTYTMMLQGTADGKNFSFKKNFSISSKEAKEWNKNAVYVKDKEQPAIWLLIGLTTFVLLGLVFLAFFIRNRKKRILND
ncbi:DUF916 and DUF3324 domain-containing protein [Enterococcus casseliflavus]|uniref:DUF916 and DUF3324 domain-containing protein n=1 Tax=Enterococcus casseliflavus TaxID=37734 RepID=UPI002330F486|nr:DUF916 and DUF3324 domain-containing protein [Enterococcus casseliflavus]MDB1688382.1 DUF916 and DUF3324 domain-containing protein [Enterococcus casseliflavus]